MSDSDWKLDLKRSAVEATRCQLNLNRPAEFATAGQQYGAQHRQELAKFTAEFRTSPRWQRFEKIRSKLQVAQSSLAEARENELAAQTQYDAFVGGDAKFDDGELLGSVSEFRNAAARHAAELSELQRALANAYDSAAEEFGRLLAENQTAIVAAAKQAVVDVQTRLENAVSALVDEFGAAQGRWHSAMQAQIDPHARPVESALGPRPTFSDADDQVAAAVPTMNAMRPVAAPDNLQTSDL